MELVPNKIKLNADKYQKSVFLFLKLDNTSI